MPIHNQLEQQISVADLERGGGKRGANAPPRRAVDKFFWFGGANLAGR